MPKLTNKPSSWNEAADSSVSYIYLRLNAEPSAQLSDIRAVYNSFVNNHYEPRNPLDGLSAGLYWTVIGSMAAEWGMLNDNLIKPDEVVKTLIRKQRDYGHENIARFGRQGLMVRVHDKIARLENLTSAGKEPQNESIRDTVLDILGYSVIGLMWERGIFLLELEPE